MEVISHSVHSEVNRNNDSNEENNILDNIVISGSEELQQQIGGGDTNNANNNCGNGDQTAENGSSNTTQEEAGVDEEQVLLPNGETVGAVSPGSNGNSSVTSSPTSQKPVLPLKSCLANSSYVNRNESDNTCSNNNAYNNNINNNNSICLSEDVIREQDGVVLQQTTVIVSNKISSTVSDEKHQNISGSASPSSQVSHPTSTASSEVKSHQHHHHHRVKFTQDVTGEDTEQENNMTMNHHNTTLASSHPVMNDTHGLTHTKENNLVNSHPHVTISQEIPKEDRAFRTKIDNSYQGWDNPFRPEGELSHDAEEILRLWKQGKLKNADWLLHKEGQDHCDSNQTTLPDGQTSPQQQNGGQAVSTDKNGIAKPSYEVKQVTQQLAQQPQQSQKVTLGGDEPKKKKGCCSLM